jgi:hypothetical protein
MLIKLGNLVGGTIAFAYTGDDEGAFFGVACSDAYLIFSSW